MIELKMNKKPIKIVYFKDTFVYEHFDPFWSRLNSTLL